MAEKKEVLIIKGGGDTPDVVLTKNELGLLTADVRDRGLRYNPNPYPLKERKKEA